MSNDQFFSNCLRWTQMIHNIKNSLEAWQTFQLVRLVRQTNRRMVLDLSGDGWAPPSTDPCSIVSCYLHTLEFGHILVQSSGRYELIKGGQFGRGFSYNWNNQCNGLQPHKSLFPREEGNNTTVYLCKQCIAYFCPYCRNHNMHCAGPSPPPTLSGRTRRGAPVSACLQSLLSLHLPLPRFKWKSKKGQKKE